MTRSNAFLATLAGAALLPITAMSQPRPVTAPLPGVPADTMVFINGAAPIVPFGGRIDVVRSAGSVMGQVVKNKPYSADSITESTQILADGNRITSRNEARFARDSAGRTRSEQMLGALGPWQTGGEPVTLITINDAVADVTYSLNTSDQTAWQSRPFRLTTGGNVQWQAATPVTAPLPTSALPAAGTVPVPERGVAFTVRRGAAALGEPPPPETFELPLPPPGAVAGGVAFAPSFSVAAVAPAAEAATADLGEQVLEGVLAHGTRTTQTIAAGAIGNERAIEIVAEEWYSEQIEAVVLRRNYDPRFGETVYRLVNVVRNEQAPDLFTVPSGYKIQVGPPGAAAFGVAGTVERDAGDRVERRVFLLQSDQASPTK